MMDGTIDSWEVDEDKRRTGRWAGCERGASFPLSLACVSASIAPHRPGIAGPLVVNQLGVSPGEGCRRRRRLLDNNILSLDNDDCREIIFTYHLISGLH